MKRNLLGFAAVVLAVSFSSFTNVKMKDTKTFYHVGNQYVETLPEGLSCQPDDVACRLEFNGINLPSGSFAETSIPSSSDYTVTRQEENASYQD